MKSAWIAVSGILGFLSVALGAFGAHGLKNKLDANAMSIYQTAVHYHALHAIALFALSLSMTGIPAVAESEYAKGAAWGFTVGVFIFSGSLYALALTGITKLGAITPIGGLCFLVGWASVFMMGLKLSKS